MQCAINFVENPLRLFTPGDSVELSIELKIEEATNIDEIYIKVIGYARCEFKSMRKGKHVHGHVNYIDRKITLLNIAELSPGTHRFEGNFTLPYDIPSSIECLNGEWKKASGCIRYKVEVHINRLGQVEDKFETAFNVVNSVDLNEISPVMLAPLMQEVHRQFSFDWSLNCYMTASIPQRAFTPGERIEVNVNVDNMSRTRVRNVRISLNRIMFMTSNTPTKEVMRVVIVESLEYCDQVKPHCFRCFTRYIRVPALEPNIENCELIRINYEIHVKAKISGLHRSLNLRLPVLIGTVPLHDARDVRSLSEVSSSYYGTFRSSEGRSTRSSRN